MLRKRQNNSLLLQMVWPILIELVVIGLISNLIQAIINDFSSEAVATIGSGNQILVLIINIYAIITVGLSIVLAQVVGGKRYEECNKIINVALVMNLLLSIVISILGVLCIPFLLRMIHIPKELEGLAKQYLSITIGFSFVQAILNTLTAVYRSFGYMKKVTITIISVNLLNLALTKMVSVLIPHDTQNLFYYATTGVIAQCIGIVLFICMLYRDKEISFHLSLKEGLIDCRKTIIRIFRIGIPGGLEAIIYLISQTIIVGFIGMIGTQAMFTRAIVGNITYYMGLATSTITIAAASIIGQLMGAGKIEEVKIACKKNMRLIIAITVPLCVVLMMLGGLILGIYTDDKAIITIAIHILQLNILLEIVRGIAANMVTTLKAVGDVDFPFVLIIFASIINVIVSYYLAIYMEMGLYGIWIGNIVELALRGVACMIRWKKGRWEYNGLYYIGK